MHPDMFATFFLTNLQETDTEEVSWWPFLLSDLDGFGINEAGEPQAIEDMEKGSLLGITMITRFKAAKDAAKEPVVGGVCFICLVLFWGGLLLDPLHSNCYSCQSLWEWWSSA